MVNIINDVILLRGRLKHSWLENQVCNKTVEDVVLLWRNGKWEALEKEFGFCVEETLHLADEMVAGFSPAQLVEKLAPLHTLSPQTKDRLKHAIHNAYLESSRIQELALDLRNAATSTEDELKRLLAIWNKPPRPDDEPGLRSRWDAFREKADDLLVVLSQLPTGIVLP